MANGIYPQAVNEPSYETNDMHSAVTSLIDELKTVNWYTQRIDTCRDKNLKAILTQKRDEEKQQAANLLDWINRNNKTLSKELKEFISPEINSFSIDPKAVDLIMRAVTYSIHA